ncbi:MAG: hypothetical protein VX908_08320 [Planctomycetota bacterium]|nr:hypothetical protein [Planctomycetota bacterium]
MESVHKIINLARSRVRLSRALHAFQYAACALACVALVLSVLDRLPAESFLPWPVIAYGLLVLLAVTTMLAWVMARPSDLSMAALVDHRLDLDDRLGTALQMARRGDPVAIAVVKDASAAAGDPRTAEQVRRTLRPVPPGNWWVPPSIIIAALLVGFMGQADLFASSPEPPADDRIVMEADTSIDEVTSVIEEQPQLKEAMSELLQEMEEARTRDAGEEQALEDTRREQLKQMTEIERALDEVVSGEQGQAMESLRESLRQLDQPDSLAASEFAEALSEGDFSKAASALEAMQEQLASGSMSDEEREALAEQLEALAEQLKELAADEAALKEALKQAGLDEQLAGDPAALEEALQQAEQLNEQQRQQLMNLMKSQQSSQQACNKLGKACSKMAGQCKNGTPGSGSFGKEMGNQLSELEQAQEMLKQARAAQSACRSSCQSLGRGLPSSMGRMGNLGGGSMDVAEDETGTTARQESNGSTGGPVIGQMETEGPLRTGQSSKSFEDIMSRSAEGFDEAFSDAQLPRKYHELIKHYFGNAGEVTDAVEYDAAKAGDDDATNTEPAAPSEDSAPEEPEEGAGG